MKIFTATSSRALSRQHAIRLLREKYDTKAPVKKQLEPPHHVPNPSDPGKTASEEAACLCVKSSPHHRSRAQAWQATAQSYNEPLITQTAAHLHFHAAHLASRLLLVCFLVLPQIGLELEVQAADLAPATHVSDEHTSCLMTSYLPYLRCTGPRGWKESNS